MVARVVAALALIAVSGTAFAADYGAPPPQTSYLTAAPAAGWTVTLGVEGRYMPKFDGSDRYELSPAPIFSIRRAGTNATFKAPRDGASITLFEAGGLAIGPTGKIRRGRDDADDIALTGLNDVDWAVELGGFVEYWFSPLLRTRAEIRKGVTGHYGVIGDITADVVYPLGPQWTLSGGPRLTLASAAANDPYFGITPLESVRSGLPVYSPGGGVRSWGAGAQLRYQISPQWAAHTYVEYERLSEGAANSPLVTLRGSRDQVTVGLGVAYSFDIPSFGF
jgi:outer membrane protein